MRERLGVGTCGSFSWEIGGWVGSWNFVSRWYLGGNGWGECGYGGWDERALRTGEEMCLGCFWGRW